MATGGLPAIAPVLRVVPEAQLQAAEKAAAEKKVAEAQALSQQATTQLAGFIRQQWEIMRTHRNRQAGWSERLLHAMRTFNGQYDAQKLQQIRQFEGSEVFARTIAMKCRGATSLLRDVYLAPDRPWGIAPPQDPDIAPEIIQSITKLVTAESMTVEQGGQPIDLGAIRDRVNTLMEAAREAAKKSAGKKAKIVEEKIDEILSEGGFYKALAEFLVDLPLFPYACVKGPVIKIVPTVKWVGGRAQVVQKPRMFWVRVSPFDVYWTPGVAYIEDASIIEKGRLTRADLNDLLDLPGYNQKEIRAVLDEYGRGGLADNWDQAEPERAVQENRENPTTNRSGLISYLEFHGNVQGLLLLEHGMDPAQIEDPLRDYMVQGWLIGTHVVKCQLTPSPRKRHPYFVTSFEKVPGTPVGNGLPDILSDIQDVMNATLRALVNNLSIASGPQVVINDDRLAPDEDGEGMYPWKRWHMKSDPMGDNSQVPVSFFMPTSNSQQLLEVYQKFNDMADELSAIPKYLTGNSAGGGAGRTASGLAMLMGNASKILQTVAANVDRDVLDPALSGLFDLVMLTDESGLLTGEEEVRVLGVNVAVQRETQRSRQLEFLQTTANPLDVGIMGLKGRGVVLRSVSQTIGLDGEKIVPTEAELEAREQQQQDAQQAQVQAAQAQGGQQSSNTTQDMGPRTNLQAARPKIAGGVG
jgi:hypothetical protein